MRRLHNIGRLFTGTQAGVIEKAAIICDDDEHIAWCGRAGEEPIDLLGYVAHEDDCGGGLVTAGLIDAHTHPVYAGNRMAEIAMRTAGASYEEIAKAGGGIVATVKATRDASYKTLEKATGERLRKWLEGGATTVEAKTGYHLEREGELEATRILKRLSERDVLPRIEVTFLAAHAQPPDRGADLGKYTKQAASWCGDAYSAGARFCDVFCDRGYFSVSQTRRILKAAIKAQLIPRLHADELARTGGARLAAELHAASADHLLRANRGDAVALARAGVVATLAPGTALSMGRLPPVKDFLAAGTTIALGTDHNPGTSGITSMSVVVAMAVAVFKLSVERALLAATVGGAASVARLDRGAVAATMLADLVLWDADHEGAFAWSYGLRPLRVWRGGAQVLS
ncbi:MAG: imidazolonepropionase [Chloroflexi bacterium]|nr:MAG: imidazolonepropionase [Chloroflexota bacterium]TME53199.1 MAG: imidazolonepropionase [Chloroflexota bacterium]